MGVLAGLSSASITRLKYTIRDLPARVRKIQSDLEEEMSSLGSFRTYRASLKAATGPVIPFMYALLLVPSVLTTNNKVASCSRT